MDASSPTLSIIVPCFRSDYGLRDQVNALIHQRDAPAREILLCNNGGNDWLTPWVASLDALPADVDIRVVDATAHPGQSFAVNRGIAEASSDLLAFCDDDDVVHPRWARIAVDMLAEHPVVTGGVVTRTDVEMASLDLDARWRLLEAETVATGARPVGLGSIGPALMGGNFAARREALLAVDGFDTGLVTGGSDNDLGYRLRAAGIPIVDCGEMSILYIRPAGMRQGWRVRRRAGLALAEVVSARSAWDSAAEFRRPPVIEVVRAGAALGAMTAGLKSRDLSGAADRLATAVGLTQGWWRHRVLRRRHPSNIGLGLN